MKDVSTSRVATKEHAIFHASQLDLVYAQSKIIYDIILDALRLNHACKFKLRSHVDGIIGSACAKSMDQVRNQMQKKIY